MRFLILIVFIFLGLSSCYQDELIDNSQEIIPDPEVEAEETGLVGRALENDGSFMTNFELEVNGLRYNTESSFYYHKLNYAKKRGQFIFLKKNDEVLGVANAYLIENDINYLELKAFPNKKSEDLSNSISLNPELNLNTTNAEIKNSAGQVVTQDVLVNHTVSSDLQILNNLGVSARQNTNDILAISPRLAFYFDLSNSHGDVLSISELAGFNLNTNFSSDEGLFYLDTDLDEWILVKESANLVSGFYLIARYEHGVYVEGEIIKEQDPISFMSFETNVGQFNYNGLSSSLGRWGSVIPQSSDVNFDLSSPCGDPLDSQELKGSEAVKDDYSISVDEDVENLLKVDTQVFDCEGNIQTLPGISLQSGVQGDADFIYLFNDADVDTWIPVCSQEFELGGYSILDNTYGPLIDWSLNQGDEIDYLSNCEQYEDGYSYVKIRDDMQLYEPFEIEVIDGGLTQLKERGGKISLIFNGDTEGFYETQQVGIVINDPEFSNSHGYYVSCLESGCGIEDFNVTHYEQSSEGWIRVSFSGKIWMLRTSTQDAADYFEIEGVLLSKI